MRQVTKDEVAEILDALVAEKGPDYKYEPDADTGKCLYWHGNGEGQPGCIAGNAFARLGLPVSVMQRYEGKSAGFVCNKYEEHNILFEYGAERLLSIAQNNQDKGNTWKASVAAAKEGRFLEPPVQRPTIKLDTPEGQ